MLTKRGWGLLSGSMILGAAGRTIGVIELYVLAAGGVGLLLMAILAVLVRGRVALEGRRRLVPSRVHAGSDSRVELEVTNPGSRTTPVVTLRDTVVAERGAAAAPRLARFQLAPLRPEESNRAAYRLGAERRGVFRVGPLEVVVSDPFGLVSVTSEAAATTELTVYPRVEVVVPPPLTTGHDPRSGGGHATFLGHGDEFYGLRAYEVGDDLRQVHWPSTARQDELMIRQHELPWQGRSTVLLDVRSSAHDDASFEQAVSAAASLLTASWKRDSQVRLLTTEGLDSNFGSGTGHIEAAMEHLAVVERGRDRLEPLVGAMRRRATGALVVITTHAGARGMSRLAVASGGFGWRAVVTFAGGRASAADGTAAAPLAAVHVPVGPGQSFAEAWNRALVAAPVGFGRR
ncbi:MAG TPA: DUF58 domain-containing protein [Acidimicrobiales bacterium]